MYMMVSCPSLALLSHCQLLMLCKPLCLGVYSAHFTVSCTDNANMMLIILTQLLTVSHLEGNIDNDDDDDDDEDDEVEQLVKLTFAHFYSKETVTVTTVLMVTTIQLHLQLMTRQNDVDGSR